MTTGRFVVALWCLSACAVDVCASPQIQLTIRDGRVWLVASDSTPAQILAEWESVGRTTVVHRDQMPNESTTLTLEGVTEREALEIVLKTAGGYLLSRRPETPDAASISRFDRIVVLPARVASPEVRPSVPEVAGNSSIETGDGNSTPSAAPRFVPLPPGFAEPPQAAPAPSTAAAPSAPSPGVPIPGMIAPPPPTAVSPQSK